MNWQDPVDVRAYRREYMRAWRAKNADAYNAAVREKRKNPEKARKHAESTARWRTRFPDRNREAKARWQRANQHMVRAAVQRWFALNRERGQNMIRKANAKRRAWKVQAKGVCSREQLEARIAFYGWRCYLCTAPFQHVDHVIPLSRGGSNWPANLRPACATCNTRKHNRKLQEWKR